MSAEEITRIPVRAERPYDVLVGHGLLGELRSLLGDHCRRVAIIAPAMFRRCPSLSRALHIARSSGNCA